MAVEPNLDGVWMNVVDGYASDFFGEMYSELLDDPDNDVLWSPSEEAATRRKSDEETDGYDFPFMSVYRPGTFDHDESRHNHPMKSGNVAVLLPDRTEGDPLTKIRIVPVIGEYEVAYFDGSNRSRRNLAEQIWKRNTRSGKPFKVPTPFEVPADRNRDDEVATLEMTHNYTLPDQEDLSDVEEIFGSGVEFRLEGTMILEGVFIEALSEQGAIEEITIDFLVENLNNRDFKERVLEVT